MQFTKENILKTGALALSVLGLYLIHNNISLHLTPFLMILVQKLFFVPVILASFWYGFRGGFPVSLLCVVLYPHQHHMMEHNHFFVAGQNTDMVLLLIVGVITGFLRDVIQKTADERDIALKKLEKSIEKIKENERLAVLGEFSAAIAHEVRNPLYGMLGSVEILEKKIDKDDNAFFCIPILKKEIERLKRLTGNFLLYAHQIGMERTKVDLVELIKERAALLRDDVNFARVVVSIQEPEKSILIEGHEDSLQQVFLNLFYNAADALVQVEKPEVRVSVSINDGNYVITVSDNGCGMDRETLESAFKPFFSGKQKGTGLGLAITKRIIDEHHGSIRIESEPEKGATFVISLPVSS